MNRLVKHALQSSSMCQRGCCWTPFIHSREAVDCRCHDLDEDQVAAEVHAQLVHDQLFARGLS